MVLRSQVIMETVEKTAVVTQSCLSIMLRSKARDDRSSTYSRLCFLKEADSH